MGTCCTQRDLSIGPHKFLSKPASEESSPNHKPENPLECTADETLNISHTLLDTQEHSSDHLEFFSPEHNSPELLQEPSKSPLQAYIESHHFRNTPTLFNDLPASQLRSLNHPKRSTDASYFNPPMASRVSVMKSTELIQRASVPILSRDKQSQVSKEPNEWTLWIRSLSIEEILDLLDDSTQINGTVLSVGWNRTIYSKRTLALGRITEMLRKGKIKIETILDLEILEKIFSFILDNDEELRFWTNVFIMQLLKAYSFAYISITEDELLLFNFSDMLNSPDEQMRCVMSKIIRYLLKASSDSRLKIEDYEDGIFPKALYRITHSFTQPKYFHSHLVTLRLLISNPKYSFMNLYSQDNQTQLFLDQLQKDIENMKSHEQFLKYEYRINKIYQGILEDVKEYQYIHSHPNSLYVPTKYLEPETSNEPLHTHIEPEVDISTFQEADEVLHILDSISNILEDKESSMVSKQRSNSDTLDSENLENSMG